MDPLASVFSITGSDSGSMTGDMMVHPGDSASPLEIIEWLDRVDEKLDAKPVPLMPLGPAAASSCAAGGSAASSSSATPIVMDLTGDD